MLFTLRLSTDNKHRTFIHNQLRTYHPCDLLGAPKSPFFSDSQSWDRRVSRYKGSYERPSATFWRFHYGVFSPKPLLSYRCGTQRPDPPSVITAAVNSTNHNKDATATSKASGEKHTVELMATSDVIRTDYVLPLKTSARSDLSQSTYADMVDADTTPPTSSSGLSSQDNVLHAGQPRAQTKPLEPTSMGIYTQRLEQPSLTSAGVNNGVVSKSHANSLSQGGSEKAAQGQKRTASGEVKQSNDGGSGSRDTSGIRGHSRTTSTASNGNRIAEVCF